MWRLEAPIELFAPQMFLKHQRGLCSPQMCVTGYIMLVLMRLIRCLIHRLDLNGLIPADLSSSFNVLMDEGDHKHINMLATLRLGGGMYSWIIIGSGWMTRFNLACIYFPSTMSSFNFMLFILHCMIHLFT